LAWETSPGLLFFLNIVIVSNKKINFAAQTATLFQAV